MTSIIVTGFDELGVTANQIAELHQKLNGDLTPLMQDIGVILARSSKERFASKQDPDGNYWASLLPSTTKRKVQAKDGGDSQNILVASGRLSNIIYHLSQNEVAVGTPESYGVYHQFGTNHMVARPFLGISNQDEADIYKVINQYLQGD